METERAVKKYTVFYAIVCAAIALAFAYLLLDFFVIPHRKNIAPEKILVNFDQTPVPMVTQATQPSETAGPETAPATTPDGGETPAPSGTKAPADSPAPTQEPTPAPTPTPEPDPTPEPTVFISDNEYHDGEKDIVITAYRVYDTDVYVADIVVKSVGYLRTAFAKNQFGRNILQETSTMAKNNFAILAINGDYYGKRDNGYVVRNAEIWRRKVSARNERATYQDLAILQNGSFKIFEENKVDMDELVTWSPWQVFSFGPGLLIDGEIAVGKNEDVLVHTQSNPRTAVAEIEPKHYLFAVSDGRTGTSAGLSLYQLAEFLKSLGATQAYNLDGGGSSTMVFNGRLINHPVNDGRITERYVSDIVYISR